MKFFDENNSVSHIRNYIFGQMIKHDWNESNRTGESVCLTIYYTLYISTLQTRKKTEDILPIFDNPEWLIFNIIFPEFSFIFIDWRAEKIMNNKCWKNFYSFLPSLLQFVYFIFILFYYFSLLLFCHRLIYLVILIQLYYRNSTYSSWYNEIYYQTK